MAQGWRLWVPYSRRVLQGWPDHGRVCCDFHLLAAFTKVAADKSYGSAGFTGRYVHMFLPSEVVAQCES